MADLLRVVSAIWFEPILLEMGAIGTDTRYQGDIVHVKAFGKHFIIINSLEVVSDLLDKRSSKYSSRPRLPMVNEL